MNYIDDFHMKYLADKTPVQTCTKCGRDFYSVRPPGREAHYPPNQFEVPVTFARSCGGSLVPFQPSI